MANIQRDSNGQGSTPMTRAVVQLEKGGQTANHGATGVLRLPQRYLPVNGKLLPNRSVCENIR